jgi:hypothetical protein
MNRPKAMSAPSTSVSSIPSLFRRKCLLVGILAATFSTHTSANEFTIAPNISGGFGHYFWSFQIDGAPAVGNPVLTLMTGQSYSFVVNTSTIHPFWIETARGLGGTSPYMGSGLSANGVTAPTTITFDVPADAPAILYYACGNHTEMTNSITVIQDLIFRSGFE